MKRTHEELDSRIEKNVIELNKKYPLKLVLDQKVTCLEYSFKPADVITSVSAPVVIDETTSETKVMLMRETSAEIQQYKGQITSVTDKDLFLFYNKESEEFTIRKLKHHIAKLKFREKI
jgi:hypothetical protein